MFKIDGTLDKVSHYLYNVSVGCTVYMFFNFDIFTVSLTIVTIICAMLLSLFIDNLD